ncbi:TonB-dependent siderophore receptor [Sporomusa sp. GT1]|uniref:TonB-dependent receptor plug domain-containing protein n=1 Tax=Sporomusa sp. GT1 TaxID=1534747 RepID=UPI001665BD5A|nr:TonB-dependent receptor [Sporomusa sp. GT1]
MKKQYLTKHAIWKKMCLGLLVANYLCFSGGGALAAAKGEVETFSLDSVVVTAQRSETRDLNTPAAVTVITAAELKETGAISVFDALEHTIGFNSISFGPAGTDYGMSSGRTIIRGLERGALILVNGSPINLLNYNGSNGIPLEAVEKVEVIRGAGSTLYGSEALAGVVNIITKKPGSSQQNTIGITGGNYNQNWSVSSEFGNSAIYLKREYIAAVGKTSRDNLTSKKDNTLVQPYGLDKGTKDSFYFTTQLSDELNFNWSYTDLQSNRPRYNTDGSRDMLYKYDDVRNNLNLSYDNKDDNFKSVLSFNKRHAFGNKYDYKTGDWGISERYNMYGINWDNQKTWKLRDDRDTLIAGVTLAREHYNGLPGSTAVKYNNALRNSFAVYGAYTYNINPEFSTTLGLRENVIKDYATDKNVFLPQIQTLYKINDNTSWYTNIGKSFQMPALNQYFSKQSTDFNRLKPQQGWSYETGIKIIDNNQSFKAALYHMDIKDQFVWKKNPDKTDYMANAGNFRNTGMELEYVKILNNNWKYNLGFSYSNPENNENGSWEQCNSRIQTTAGITYNQEKWLTNVNFLFLGDREESYYKINGNISDIPDRVQLNAMIRYQPERNQSVILNLYNILDRNNSVNKYENLDLPFNWALSYNYTF